MGKHRWLWEKHRWLDDFGKNKKTNNSYQKEISSDCVFATYQSVLQDKSIATGSSYDIINQFDTLYLKHCFERKCMKRCIF